MNLLARIKSLFSPVAKGGAPFPFNQPGLTGVLGVRSLSRPYEQSPWVMRAIKRIASPIAAVSLQFYTDSQDTGSLIADPALLGFWRNPARGLSYHDFIEATVGWLKLEGEAFWILDDTWLAPFPGQSIPGQMLLARPDRMKLIIRNGILEGWEFTDRSNNRHVLLPEQVIQPKFWNPYDDFRGSAEYKSTQIAAEADYMAGLFNRNLMENNGDQGVYIVAKGGIPTDEQRQQIIMQLREKREMQQRGYFKPVFLSGDISIEDPKVRVPDAAFIAARLENRHEIYIALGVPPSMADVVASYSVGSASDRYLLIEETCMPLGSKIAESISQVARRQTGQANLCAQMDWDEHSVMQQVRRERVDSAVKLWAVGMPMEEISDYLKLNLPEFPGWDIGYLPFNVAPVGDPLSSEPATDPTSNPDYAEPQPDSNPVADMLRALRGEKAEVIDPRPEVRARDPKEHALWKKHMAARAPTIKDYRNKFNQILMQARAITLAKIEARGRSPSAASTRAAAADLLFQLPGFRTQLLASLRPVGLRALDTSGSQLYQEIGRDDPFKYPPKLALEFLHRRENRLSDTANEVWNEIRTTIDQSLLKGDPIKDMAAAVRAKFNEISSGRAKTIAMTETSACFGQGRAQAMRAAGVEHKKWLTSGNDNVRPAHAEANGQIREINDPFEVGGEDLMQPGDPDGSPENVINCHCVSIAVQDDAEETT